jgi:hypothetical protein
VAQEALFDKEYAPTANVDVEALMKARATAIPQELNWRESIVGLMKLWNIDSSLNARKKLAQQWGYNGALNGSAEMNIWLYQQVIRRIRGSGGKCPGRNRRLRRQS